MILSSPLYAECNYDLLKVTKWEATQIKGTSIKSNDFRMKLVTEFELVGNKPIRMVDASTEVEDVLGQDIGRFAVDSDIQLSAGEVYTQDGIWGRYTFERLVKLIPADVVTKVCVRGVVYQDGNVKKF